jgi:hypothetical protein
MHRGHIFTEGSKTMIRTVSSSHDEGLRGRRSILVATGAVALLAFQSTAPLQAQSAYKLNYSSYPENYGELFTPNPFPPLLTLSPNGQLALSVDAKPDQPATHLSRLDFHWTRFLAAS